MRYTLLCLSFVSLTAVLSAQSKSGMLTAQDTSQMNGALRQLYFRSVVTDTDDARREAAQQADIDTERRVFRDKAKHFVDLWSKMTKQMSERNTFDAKLANKVSHAFHDLEKSNGWPVRQQK